MLNPISDLNIYKRFTTSFFNFVGSISCWSLHAQEIKHLLRLAIPVLSAYIFGALMEICDTSMAGRVSVSDLTIVGTISAFWFPILILFQNILLNTLPLIVRFHGAQQYQKIRETFWNGLALALGISITAIIILSYAPNLFSIILSKNDSNHDAIILIMRRYCEILRWGCPAFFLFSVCKSLADGAGQTIIGTIIGFIGLCCNIFFNYLFIYGSCGFPQLGGLGCAFSTVLSYWIMTLLFWANFLYFSRTYQKILGLKIFCFQKPNQKILVHQLLYGSINGLVHFIETLAFSAATLFLNTWSTNAEIEVASIRIATVVSDFLYLLPLSIGIAATIRIGGLLGKKSSQNDLNNCKNASLFLGLIVATFNCISLIFLRHRVACCFNQCPNVQYLSKILLTYAAIYQIPEAVQVICFGILRAHQELLPLLFLNIFSYWIVAIPLGIVLGLTSKLTIAPLGASGFWISLVVGLTCAAIFSFLRVLYLFSKKNKSFNKIDS